MPPGLLALIPAIAAIVGTGVSVGETLANQPSGGPSPQPTPTAPTTPTTTANPQLAAQLAAQQSGNLQAATGGSLAPPAFSEMLANMTGNPGDTQSIQNLVFGSGNQGLSDMISQLSPAPAQSLTTPQGGG